MKVLERWLAWVLAAGVMISLVLALLGLSLLAFELVRTGKVGLGEMQVAAWRGIYVAIMKHAMAPHLILTALFWGALARWRPSLDSDPRTLYPGLPIAAALCFPIVGHVTFTVWEPGGAFDYVATLLLLAGSVSAALMLVRRFVPGLGPGFLAGGDVGSGTAKGTRRPREEAA